MIDGVFLVKCFLHSPKHGFETKLRFSVQKHRDMYAGARYFGLLLPANINQTFQNLQSNANVGGPRTIPCQSTTLLFKL
jgi:hypothetical protein